MTRYLVSVSVHVRVVVRIMWWVLGVDDPFRFRAVTPPCVDIKNEHSQKWNNTTTGEVFHMTITPIRSHSCVVAQVIANRRLISDILFHGVSHSIVRIVVSKQHVCTNIFEPQ